jgi:hypothetical protein
MADNFGLKIGVEGEKEFKNALADINRSVKVLGSEMKLVESEFYKQDNSVAALTARNEVLNKQIDEQKNKISILEQALANAAESFGENDRRTQAWAVQLNNAKADLNNMEYELEQSANEADKLGDGLEDSGESAGAAGGKFEKLGGILKGSALQWAQPLLLPVLPPSSWAKKLFSSSESWSKTSGALRQYSGSTPHLFRKPVRKLTRISVYLKVITLLPPIKWALCSRVLALSSRKA